MHYKRPAYHRSPWGDAQRDKAVALYRDHGLSCARIAERFGVNRKTVWAALKAAGVKTDSRQTYDGCGGGPVRVLGGGVRTESYRRP